MRKIEPIRTINLSATRVLSVMNLRKRSKRDKTSINIVNTFSQQTHNILECFCLSHQLLFVILFRCGGKADGQGLVAAHLQTLSRMRPHGGGGDDDDDEEDNDNNDDDDDDDD